MRGSRGPEARAVEGVLMWRCATHSQRDMAVQRVPSERILRYSQLDCFVSFSR